MPKLNFDFKNVSSPAFASQNLPELVTPGIIENGTEFRIFETLVVEIILS